MPSLRFPDPKINKRAWKGDIPLTNRYTAGVAGDKFFKIMKEEGRLTGTVCQKCSLTYVPARFFCERCFSDLNRSWVDVNDSGKIVSFTVVHMDLDGKQLSQPQIVAMVELADSGARMVHLLGEAQKEKLAIGQKVNAVWKPVEQREGKITDISYFKPL
ncbi:MAG: Zn-ribbon domain-containing OB-fold protein [candidate division Zixibacteria bacterium]|nr:Zn-ribbon domain-containing OB-fold protein [candidate division Zixibacteria bacterium]